MANVKITDLTELAAGDLATNDVLPIVDLNVDATKKVTIASLDTRSASNDFITFTRLNANINVVQDNVASVTVGTAADTETRLNANLDVVQDNVAAVESRRASNVTIQTAIETRRVANVTIMTNEDTALQARIAANTLVAASNDFVTYTQLNSNINVVQSNVANIIDGTTAFTGDVTLESTDGGSSAGPVIILDRQSASPADSDYLGRLQFKGKDDGGANETYAQISGKIIDASATTEDGAIEFAVKKAGSQTIVGRLKSDKLLLLNGTELSVDGASEFTGQVNMTDDLVVSGNLTINGDTTTVSTTNLDVEDRMIMLADGVSGSPSADVGLLFNRGNQGNAAFFYDESGKTFKLSDTKDPKSNTSLSPVTASNLSVGIVTAATLNATAITQNGATLDNLIASNVDGAISTVNTTDLTADRVVITNGSGKIAASSGVTPTELGYLDGLTLGTVAASKAVTADSNGDVNFIREVDIDGNVVIGTNDSNTVTIVGKLDLGAFS